jgi:cell division protease FtsH
MVSIYGLNDKVGNISFYDPQGNNQFTKPYSDDTARIIDKEVSKLIESQYERAKQILKDNETQLILLAEKLLEKEVIFKEDLVAIFGVRHWDEVEVENPNIEEDSTENKTLADSINKNKISDNGIHTEYSSETKNPSSETSEEV